MTKLTNGDPGDFKSGVSWGFVDRKSVETRRNVHLTISVGPEEQFHKDW
jgi:hypothetical protein